MRIKKIENAIGLVGNVLNKLSKSNKDTYSTNYLNERLVRVSQNEPETGEKLWIKPNKNLFNINTTPSKTYYSTPTINGDTLQTSGTSGNFITYVIDVFPNTNYTVSVVSKTGSINVYDATIDNYIAGMGSNNNSLTFNSGSHTQIALVFYGGGTYEKPQLEQGNVATNYERYMIKKLYVKNDTGAYEEFYNANNLDVYSTEEQRIGTWIDGKPLYRRVISFNITPEEEDYTVSHNINNVDNIFVDCNSFLTSKGVSSVPLTNPSKSITDDYTYGKHYTRIQVTPTNVVVHIGGYTHSGWGNVYVILNYTKTTD